MNRNEIHRNRFVLRFDATPFFRVLRHSILTKFALKELNAFRCNSNTDVYLPNIHSEIGVVSLAKVSLSFAQISFFFKWNSSKKREWQTRFECFLARPFLFLSKGNFASHFADFFISRSHFRCVTRVNNSTAADTHKNTIEPFRNRWQMCCKCTKGSILFAEDLHPPGTFIVRHRTRFVCVSAVCVDLSFIAHTHTILLPLVKRIEKFKSYKSHQLLALVIIAGRPKMNVLRKKFTILLLDSWIDGTFGQMKTCCE